jgi:hypothetical protein
MSSLVAERGPIHVHLGATMLIEGDAPELDELLEHVDWRLHLVPRFRQRVIPTPLHLTNPKWADDPSSTRAGTSGRPRCRGPARWLSCATTLVT